MKLQTHKTKRGDMRTVIMLISSNVEEPQQFKSTHTYTPITCSTASPKNTSNRSALRQRPLSSNSDELKATHTHTAAWSDKHILGLFSTKTMAINITMANR